MKLNKFLCLFVLLAVVFAFASCDVLSSLGIEIPGIGGEVEKFEVKFDSKGGSEVPSQMIESGALVTEPEAPTREGYTFDGWYLGGKPWNFAESTVTKSITLSAKWTAVVEKFDVTFDSQGGNDVDAQSVKKGGLVSKPMDPTKEGYVFIGWFNGDEKWDFTADKVLADVTLTAKWECAHKDVTVLAAKAATCTENGLTEGKQCNACGVIILAQTEIPAAHTVMIDNAVAPTCGQTGLTEGSHCTVCNETIVAQEEIAATGEHTPGEAASCLVAETCSVCGIVLNPALGHTEVEIAAIAPTCTDNGKTAGKECSVCGVVLVAPELVVALGHTEVTVEAVAPGCETTGLTEGKACSVCGIPTVPQEEVPAVGHTAGAAADCTNAQTCTVCNVELAPALGHTEVEIAAVAPTCTETGLTAGKKCSVCGETLVAQEVVAALGHTAGAAADCTNAQTCTVCGDVLTAALGHTEEALAAEDPDCENTGLTAGVKCSVCNETLVAQEVIPALGHNFVDGICNNCGEDVSHKIYYYLDGNIVYTGKFFENLGLESLDDVQVPGYAISGWTDMFTGETVTSIPANTADDVLLNAVFEAIEYTITYIVDGEISTAMYTVSTDAIVLKSINSKEHFNTLGWMDENGNFVSELPAGTIGDFTFTAVYEEITYTLTYNYNDGSEPVVVEFKFSALPEIEMPANREGYLFQGWFADPEFGTRVTNLETATGDVVLYAQWEKMPGGTLTPEVPF